MGRSLFSQLSFALLFTALMATAILMDGPLGLGAAIAFFALTFACLCTLLGNYIGTRKLLLTQKRLWIYFDGDESKASDANNAAIARLWKQKPSLASPMGVAFFLLFSMATIAMQAGHAYGAVSVAPGVQDFASAYLSLNDTPFLTWLMALFTEFFHVLVFVVPSDSNLSEVSKGGLIAHNAAGEHLVTISRFVIGVILIGGLRHVFSFIEQDKRLALNAAEFGVFHHALVIGPHLFDMIVKRLTHLTKLEKGDFANRDAALSSLALLVGFIAGKSSHYLLARRRYKIAQKLLRKIYADDQVNTHVKKWAVVGMSFLPGKDVDAFLLDATGHEAKWVKTAARDAINRRRKATPTAEKRFHGVILGSSGPQ